MPEIQIGNRLIGNGHPTYIIAEIGVNHNGIPQLAFELIDIAVEAGADSLSLVNTFTGLAVDLRTRRPVLANGVGGSLGARTALRKGSGWVRIMFIGVVVALGLHAAQALTGAAEGLPQLRSRSHEWRGALLIPTYHPADLLRDAALKKDVWDDMKGALKRLGPSTQRGGIG